MRTGWLSRVATLATSLSLVACLQSPLVPCGEIVCPSATVCTPGGCATPADVEACQGKVDGDTCDASNGGTGTCQGGACRTGLCGNGVKDVGEACDDGNVISGDDCRGDCAKVEVCGDGEVDAQEQCDDKNLNLADGCDACKRTEWTASPIVGSAIVATTVALANPSGVAIDALGRIYIADTSNNRIRRIDDEGNLTTITTIAGTGRAGSSGDGGPATSAELNLPAGVAVDGVGRVYVADTANHRLRRIDIDGTITTIAGDGTAGYAGDGAAASLSVLNAPAGVAVDGLGRVFISDTGNHLVRRIDINGKLQLVAGTPPAPGDPPNSGFSGDNGPATSALLDTPYGLAVDGQGRVLIADSVNLRVRRVELDGTIVTIAGSGNPGYNGDGIAATAANISGPLSVAVDDMDRILIVDSQNHRVRRVAVDGTISTIAGTGTPGYTGDGSAATLAQLSQPFGVAIDTQGRIAISDLNNQRIRRIDGTGTISTRGGSGRFGFGGDASMATSALLADPFAMAVDTTGRVYITDTFHYSIRRIELDGQITTVAGIGLSGFSGDNGPARDARLTSPNGIVIDPQGRLVIADVFNHRVRRVDASGIITTIAGTGVAGGTGDGGPATSARLWNPNDVAIDSLGRVLIADTYNNRIRRIETNGTITTVAGTGPAGYDGDGGAATATRLAFPYNIGVDSMDRILIADTSNHRVRRVALDGTISTIAGNGTVGSGGDGGPATSAQLNGPQSVREDSLGRILVVDSGANVVRRIELDGTISTLMGTGGASGGRGDAGLATGGLLGNPHGLTLDASDRILVADTENDRIRRIEGGMVSTIAGRIDPENAGPVTKARLDDPQAIAVTPSFTLVAAGSSGTLEAIRDGKLEVVAGRYPHEVATGALARFRSSSFGNVGGTAIDLNTGLIYITETTANRLHVITQVTPDPRTWTIAPLANIAGAEGFADGAAATAQFRGPTGLLLVGRVLYIADTGNHAIRALDLDSNTVTTIANTSHSFGFGGDGGPAAQARLYRPTAITKCGNGDLFIADTGNNRVRRIVPSGPSLTISTVLGDGVPASSGEGSPATTFPVDAPRGLACDSFGNLYVTSTTTVRLVTADDLGIVDGSGAVQTIYGAPPHTFPSSVTNCLTGLFVTESGKVQVTDACTGLFLELTRSFVPPQ